ncbi:MAG: sigma 54-interacting transcriptional regulator [Candidatus Neomarinimicrobiota bacterium]
MKKEHLRVQSIEKDGKFLAANAGTIFLDEIGDMSPSLQSKILRGIRKW